jgi:uncharacterized protein
MSSLVCWSDLRTRSGMNLLEKFGKLVKAAGIGSIDFKDKFVAIKIHFGEPGNLAYIRPNYVAVISKLVAEAGGKPFLTDSNTLYSGRRANAVDHARSAVENGFSHETTGCDVLIADGLKGIDYREIPIPGEYCKTAKIGSAIAEADIVISLTHFKGHELTGFGGALKNLGMGSASRGGKLELHSTSKPRIETANCTGCGVCVRNCAHGAIGLDAKRKAVIDYEKCVGCGQCIAVCRYEAALPVWDNASSIANCKIAEYALASVKDKPSFHISFVVDVSPDCDCWNSNDAPLVPNLGIFASADPVALDAACVDAVNDAPALPSSVLGDKQYREGDDKFTCIHPETDWRAGLEHAEKIGLGTMTYELKKV